ncbi:MAG: CDP-diacylglycerol--glycerol-3-phosphate 3-phosphatidyltransferase [Candidatus Limnocylindria bacterium]
MRTLPNAISLARALAVVPVVLLVAQPALVPWALVVFGIAALTDAVDGPLARRMGATTPLGAFLDPLADKLLVLGALVALLGQDAVDALLVGVFVVRELVVTAVRALAVVRGRSVGSSAYGRAKAALQSVAVGGQLLAFARPDLGATPAADVLLVVAAAVTVATGAGVIRRGLAEAGIRAVAVTPAHAMKGGR